jgi:predicted enzyme related to lactoylglutathione lyase
MAKAPMLRGMSTVSFWAADLAAATRWYTELLGVEPHQADTGGYVEFRLGDFQQQLEIVDAAFAPRDTVVGPGGSVVYWHVDNVSTMVERLLSMGATEHQKPVDRGEGLVTASVVDPFGNVLGVMFNPHFLHMWASHVPANAE